MSLSKFVAAPFSRLLLFALIALATGCRSAPPLPTPPKAALAAPSAGPTNLYLWHSETGAAREELNVLAARFHAEYPDLTLSPVWVGSEDDLRRKVVAAIALGQTPDLVLAPRRDLVQFARQGGLSPLDDWGEDTALGLSEQDQADFFPGVLDEGRFVEFGNQQYGFPFDLDGMVLYFNVDLLSAASFSKPPTTWSDFLDIASKATKDQQYGWDMAMDADVFTAMLVSQGSAAVDLPERRALFAERGGLAAMTLAAQLVKAGAAHSHLSRTEALTEFAAGNAALYMDWMSALPEIEAAQKKAGAQFAIGLSNLPQSDPSDPYMLVGGSDLALFRLAPERARWAWFLIRWLTAAEQTAQWTGAAHAIPLRASALGLLPQDAAHAARLQQIRSGLGGVAPHFVPRTANRRAADIEHLMEVAWLQALGPKADISKILSSASDEANTMLAGSP